MVPADAARTVDPNGAAMSMPLWKVPQRAANSELIGPSAGRTHSGIAWGTGVPARRWAREARGASARFVVPSPADALSPAERGLVLVSAAVVSESPSGEGRNAPVPNAMALAPATAEATTIVWRVRGAMGARWRPICRLLDPIGTQNPSSECWGAQLAIRGGEKPAVHQRREENPLDTGEPR